MDRLLIGLFLLIINIGCEKDLKEKDIILTKENNSVTSNLYCSIGDSQYYIRIKNSYKDTLIIDFPSHTEGKCYTSSREEYYNFNETKDSIYFYSVGIGDNWGEPKYDTIFPNEIKYYYSYIEWSSGGKDFVQQDYAYSFLNNRDTSLYFTLLIYNDKISKEYKQMDFIVPDGTSKIKIDFDHQSMNK